MPLCFIALGGNLGPVSQTFDRALELLERRGCLVRAASEYHRTPAVGPQAGPEFLNAAIEVETPHTAFELLDTLQSIETALGRTRRAHWGPRTIDLDLVFYERESFESPRLTVPHPACWY